MRYAIPWKTLPWPPAAPSSWSGCGKESGDGKAQGPAVLKVNELVVHGCRPGERDRPRTAPRPARAAAVLRQQGGAEAVPGPGGPPGTAAAGGGEAKAGRPGRGGGAGREPPPRVDDPRPGAGGDRRQGEGGREGRPGVLRGAPDEFSGDTVRLRHILVQTEGEAKEIQARLAKNESFEELAKKFSRDTASAPKGGDLGYLGREQMLPDFARAAFALKANEVSDPVKTPFGLHLIKLVDRKKGQPLTFDQVKAQLQRRLLDERQSQRFQAWIKELEGGAKITRDESLLPVGKFGPGGPAAARRSARGAEGRGQVMRLRRPGLWPALLLLFVAAPALGADRPEGGRAEGDGPGPRGGLGERRGAHAERDPGGRPAGDPEDLPGFRRDGAGPARRARRSSACLNDLIDRRLLYQVAKQEGIAAVHGRGTGRHRRAQAEQQRHRRGPVPRPAQSRRADAGADSSEHQRAAGHRPPAGPADPVLHHSQRRRDRQVLRGEPQQVPADPGSRDPPRPVRRATRPGRGAGSGACRGGAGEDPGRRGLRRDGEAIWG